MVSLAGAWKSAALLTLSTVQQSPSGCSAGVTMAHVPAAGIAHTSDGSTTSTSWPSRWTCQMRLRHVPQSPQLSCR